MPAFVPIGSQPIAGLASSIVISPAAGTIAGAATVSGVGEGVEGAVGVIAGHAAVSGSALGEEAAVGVIAGHATVSGLSEALDEAVGLIAGEAVVTGHTAATAFSAGDAPGEGVVDGVGATVPKGTGIIAGHATVDGISGGGSYTQISGLVRETLEEIHPFAEVVAVARETLEEINPPGRVAFVTRETLHDAIAYGRVAKLVRESLYASLSSPSTGTIEGGSSVEGVAAQNTAVGTIVGRAAVMGASITVLPPLPPQGPTLTQNIIGSYLYVQYNDDDDLQAMVASYNAYTQAYLDYLNALDLPIYTQAPVAGPLLDWVATNLYGFPRPAFPSYGRAFKGPINTFTPNSLPINGNRLGTDSSYIATNDDIYRRCLTWHFYKGDGKQMDIKWLKRRVKRFLYGVNGLDFDVGETYEVSLIFTGPQAVTITVPPGPVSTILQAGIESGILETPFQIAFTVAT